MRGLYRILALIGVVFVACTTDAGYDPREEFEGKPVDYIVEGFANYRHDYYLPHCDSLLQGKMFYVEENSKVYGCIDGRWSEMRSLSRDADELVDLPYYDPSSVSTASLVDMSKIRFSSITDPRDDRTYRTVIVEGLEWFAQNLNYDGGQNTVYDQCASLLGSENCRLYTRYYNIGAVGSTLDDICPLDFEIPSEGQWQMLFEAVGGERTAGKVLKSKDFKSDKNRHGDDVISFTVLPAGYRTSVTVKAGIAAGFWSISGYGAFFSDDWDTGNFYSISSGDYLSVRCVRSAR